MQDDSGIQAKITLWHEAADNPIIRLGKVVMFQEFWCKPTGEKTISLQTAKFGSNLMKEYAHARKP